MVLAIGKTSAKKTATVSVGRGPNHVRYFDDGAQTSFGVSSDEAIRCSFIGKHEIPKDGPKVRVLGRYPNDPDLKSTSKWSP